MKAKADAEESIALTNILSELSKRDRHFSEKLTKIVNSRSYIGLSTPERKRKKVEILAKTDRPLFEDIVKALTAKHGPSGKSRIFPKSLILFLERMPDLKDDDEISQCKEVLGGNYRNL